MVNTNMFAYRLNNPVNGAILAEPVFIALISGMTATSAAEKTWDEKLNDFATGLYDYGTAVYDAHMMQLESQQQVDQNSFRYAMDSTVAVYDAVSEGIDNMNKAEYQANQATHAFISLLDFCR